jgi:hypothetical protein
MKILSPCGRESAEGTTKIANWNLEIIWVLGFGNW